MSADQRLRAEGISEHYSVSECGRLLAFFIFNAAFSGLFYVYLYVLSLNAVLLKQKQKKISLQLQRKDSKKWDSFCIWLTPCSEFRFLKYFGVWSRLLLRQYGKRQYNLPNYYTVMHTRENMAKEAPKKEWDRVCSITWWCEHFWGFEWDFPVVAAVNKDLALARGEYFNGNQINNFCDLWPYTLWDEKR